MTTPDIPGHGQAMSTVNMIGIDQYADQQQVSTRTIRRWLDDDRIPGAVKVTGRWLIPDTAIPLHPVATEVATVSRPVPATTLEQELAGLPVYIPLPIAAQLLGIPVPAIRARPEFFRLERFSRTWYIPKARIRQLDSMSLPMTVVPQTADM